MISLLARCQIVPFLIKNTSGLAELKKTAANILALGFLQMNLSLLHV